MRYRLLSLIHLPYRRMLTVGAVVAHLIVATGVPLPSNASAHGKPPSSPHPCQGRLCGCFTAEKCWAGDCCCYTLEQKLAWAEANGINPPAHVRQSVEARKARMSPPKSCCATKNHDSRNACCNQSKGSSSESCDALPCDTTEVEREHNETMTDTGDSLKWYWVAGFFAQKCHGEGPAGLLHADPSIPPVFPAMHLLEPEPGFFVHISSPPVTHISQAPPTPPPRDHSQS
jgi:hypothetical protein